MKRRKIRAVLLIAVLASGTAWSQSGANDQMSEDQFVAEARDLLQAGRKDIIAEELRLDAGAAEKFWSTYEEYHADMMVVRNRYAEIIGRYLARYEAAELDDDYAQALLDDWFDYKSDKLKVQKRYVRKFNSAMSMRMVVRFYQLENKMDAEIDAGLAVFVPLMEPF